MQGRLTCGATSAPYDTACRPAVHSGPERSGPLRTAAEWCGRFCRVSLFTPTQNVPRRCPVSGIQCQASSVRHPVSVVMTLEGCCENLELDIPYVRIRTTGYVGLKLT